MKLFYPHHHLLSTHERKLNKTKQMAARRTALRRRRTRCPLPSRSGLVLNEVSGFFFYYYLFISHRRHSRSHGRTDSWRAGFTRLSRCARRHQNSGLSLFYSANHFFHSANKKTSIVKARSSIFTLFFSFSFGDSPAHSDSQHFLYYDI